MVAITLSDGSIRKYDGAVTGLDVANDISKGLAKEAVCVRVDTELWDLTRPIESDASVQIITKKHEDGLELIRHDTAHVLAEAVKELYPEAQITIGPAIENGFYYDIFREESFSLDDLEKIENRMKEIVARDESITREVWDRNDAIKFFRSIGEEFKAELIEDLPEDQTITMYRQGEFIDLCRGPHMPSTGMLGTSFKLMKLAGAYWRGDSKNPMLQRIYGTAWANDKQLKQYLLMLEEAEKRDHRRLGKEMDLFHFQEESIGGAFWHPKGWSIYLELQKYIRKTLIKEDYVEVNTPRVLDRALWEKSGHWDKFRENMFVMEDEGDKMLALKPMSCPGHIQIFRQGIKSYRDLPIRMAEYGSCTRNEPSGAMHGLARVREMVQDDGHIFCTEAQIKEETRKFCVMLLNVYKELGFDEVTVKLSDRPEVRAGADEVWDKAETALEEGALATGLSYTLNPGEGAFYGPKLEFILRDAIGREWQCGTLQLDFVLPERLDASYIGEDGNKHRPVMLHRAVLGTFERFMSILIEHYAGKFPLWLAPVQVAVATITSEADDYGQQVFDKLREMGLRPQLDIRNEKINYKVRELSHQKVKYIFVVGAREAQEGTVAIRELGGKAQEVLALDDAIVKLKKEALPPYLRKEVSDTSESSRVEVSS